jgi:hypothetical protein
MEVNFSNKPGDTATQVVPTPEPVAALTPEPSCCGDTQCGVPAVRSNYGGGLVLGDKLPSFDDIKLPRMNIVQGIGELKDTFPQGAVVYNQATVLFVPPVIEKQTGNIRIAGTPPANITILGFRPTRFSEKGFGIGGLIVNSEAEVRAQGGTLDYREHKLKEKDGMRLFEPLAEAVVLIRRPEASADDNTVFTFDVDGAKYALALWAMKGTAYTAAAKSVFFTHRAIGCLQKGGYPSWSYNLSTRLKPFQNGNSCWVPVCVPNSKSSDAFLAFVANILNTPEAPAEA